MRTAIAITTCLILMAAASSATAQESQRGFNAQNFQMSPGYGNFLTVEGAQVPDGVSFGVGLLAGYQYKPLVIRGCDTVEGDQCTKWDDEDTALVKHYTDLQISAALGLFEIFEFGLVVPVVLYQVGDDVAVGPGQPAINSPAGTSGLGDLRLHLKWDLLHTFGYEGDKLGLALLPVLTFPTGEAISAGSFMGDSSLTVHPKLAFSAAMGPVRLGLNAGYVWRESKDFYLAEVGQAISYGAALDFTLHERVHLIVEAFGENGFTTDIAEIPFEADGAFRFDVGSGVGITVGGGAGIIGGVGTPAARAFLGLAWAPPQDDDIDKDGILNDDDECPTKPEDVDGFEDENGCPDNDNDKDGVKDKQDSCPDVAEDRDNFEDENGCPDPDNDGDGILDVDDKCPDDAEDVDGFEDEDGCPDPDNDKDGLLDADDQCPTDPEDVDTFEDEDGCPDPDNDGDGILDVDDKCPLEKEIVNEYLDDDGCPDEKKLVVLTDDKIEILQKVHFATSKARIKSVSFQLLDEVVGVLENNPKINVRIEGHTDSRGKARFNKKLSEKRAKAVMKYVIKKGIDPDRLTAKGFGPDQPIDSNKTEEGRAANRRVEFVITSK